MGTEHHTDSPQHSYVCTYDQLSVYLHVMTVTQSNNFGVMLNTCMERNNTPMPAEKLHLLY